MILLLAVLAGLVAGIAGALLRKEPYRPPELRAPWLAILAFVPQLVAFYFPTTRAVLPDAWASAGLITSQILLLGFAWLNRHVSGMSLIIAGLVGNLLAIIANGGFMPISPQTAARLISSPLPETGSRLGYSKDILLTAEETRLAWLSDRYLLPEWFPYRSVISLGDILIAAGAFWLLARRRLQT
ncbi:MAG: hypothetical protein D6770_11370 [Anaerolineae bacterium]|nr:MAG: hypothetical protein D6770_11370 [Anaerolineae bacterium]